MLQCTNCIRACLRTFISETLSPRPLTVPSVSVLSPRQRDSQLTARRRYIAAARTGHTPPSVTPRALGHNISGGADSLDVVENQRKKKWAIEQEIKFLRDPLKLSENTARLLRAGDKDKALELVRAISKHGTYIVAWNHLIDYEMSQKRVRSAMDIYNDVRWSPIPRDSPGS